MDDPRGNGMRKDLTMSEMNETTFGAEYLQGVPESEYGCGCNDNRIMGPEWELWMIENGGRW